MNSKVIDKKKALSAELRELYTSSKMSYDELSELTGIKSNTIYRWLTDSSRTPPEYIIKYIRMCIEDYYKVFKRNRDVIHRMDNDSLAILFTRLCSIALMAKGDREQLPAEYRDMSDYLDRTDLLKECYTIYEPHLKLDSTKAFSEQIRALYESSSYTYIEFSEILGVPVGTVQHWINGRRNPSEYVVRYAQMCFPSYKNNGDAVRRMDDATLLEFIQHTMKYYFDAKGEITNVPKKYRDFNTFFSSRHLIKPVLMIKTNSKQQ